MRHQEPLLNGPLRRCSALPRKAGDGNVSEWKACLAPHATTTTHDFTITAACVGCSPASSASISHVAFGEGARPASARLVPACVGVPCGAAARRLWWSALTLACASGPLPAPLLSPLVASASLCRCLCRCRLCGHPLPVSVHAPLLRFFCACLHLRLRVHSVVLRRSEQHGPPGPCATAYPDKRRIESRLVCASPHVPRAHVATGRECGKAHAIENTPLKRHLGGVVLFGGMRGWLLRCDKLMHTMSRNISRDMILKGKYDNMRIHGIHGNMNGDLAWSTLKAALATNNDSDLSAFAGHVHALLAAVLACTRPAQGPSTGPQHRAPAHALAPLHRGRRTNQSVCAPARPLLPPNVADA